MPYPPSGGGFSDPMMARDRRMGLEGAREYGEWPPISNLSEIQSRTTRGYNEHVFGDPPVNVRSSSTPRRGDPGYTINEDYPPASRMGREYSDYKYKNKVANTASREYRQLGDKLEAPMPHDGRAYGPVKGNKYYPEDHTRMAPMARRARETSTMHAQARTEFNNAHLCRIKNFPGHRAQEKQAYDSAKKYAKDEGLHTRYSTKNRY